MNKYRDIIALPHRVSATRPQMPLRDRAAQFSPFAALTGYEDVIDETARLTDSRIELSESKQAELDKKLQIILENISERPEVKITYFVPDKRKSGGAYETAVGFVKRIDEYALTLIFTDSRTIPIADIYSIESVILGDIEE